MGARSSRISGQGSRQPAPWPVDVPAEQHRGEEELPAEETDESGQEELPVEETDESGREELPAEETDESDEVALLRAVEAGNDGEAMRLVIGGASVSAADDVGRTALIAAASSGAGWLCAMLMDSGADVGARDRFGQTALHAAAMAEGGGEDGPVVVELLLQCGADPQVQDGCGRTALHCALQASNLEAAEVLVPAVGSQLQRDDTGRTELHWAAANGSPELVGQLLTQAKGSVSDRDCMGMTPLARALQALNRESARVLVGKVRPRASAGAADAFGRTVLHWAAYAGYPEVVRHLLRRGFSPWVVDQCGKDALHWAVESGDRLVVEEILDDEGYRECADSQGQTALHVAAVRGDAAIAALLLARGADAALEDYCGYTPLTYALRGGHRDAALLLVKRGSVSVRRRDCHLRVPLHWAAVGGDVDCVRELLARGARVNAMDAQRKTPTALALEHGHERAALVLVRTKGFRVMHDFEGRTELHAAAAAGLTQVAMELLELGADPYEGDCANESPVALALRAGHYSLAEAIARYWRL